MKTTFDKTKAPCMNCEKRSVGCHATCGAYAEYKKELEESKSKSVNKGDKDIAEYWREHNKRYEKQKKKRRN